MTTARCLRHEVRVAVYGVALAELTHPVIEAFCQRYPNVSIRVYDADFHRGLDPVLAGEYGVALARLNTDVPGMTRVPIFTEPAFVGLWKGIRWPRRPRWTSPKSSTIPGSPPTRGPTSGCAETGVTVPPRRSGATYARPSRCARRSPTSTWWG
ncbi:LysR family transcriptional regulator substrate-binding protein [Streptomyces sp. NPDC001351]|uniref:LysR family transcriptional regulator substrate-binding protein n=1 Tax=Streptomyces sp. NPDC001351 TaxID=3364564 RepID=UPI00369E128B